MQVTEEYSSAKVIIKLEKQNKKDKILSQTAQNHARKQTETNNPTPIRQSPLPPPPGKKAGNDGYMAILKSYNPNAYAPDASGRHGKALSRYLQSNGGEGSIKQTNKKYMITPKTQAAIAVLNHIYAGEEAVCPDRYGLTEEERQALLSQLTAAKLIIPTEWGNPEKAPSYIPARKAQEVSLLDILEATGEHLNCNHPTTEKFYMSYGKAAQKLGVVNHITRTYLKEIKLYDL